MDPKLYFVGVPTKRRRSKRGKIRVELLPKCYKVGPSCVAVGLTKGTLGAKLDDLRLQMFTLRRRVKSGTCFGRLMIMFD